MSIQFDIDASAARSSSSPSSLQMERSYRSTATAPLPVIESHGPIPEDRGFRSAPLPDLPGQWEPDAPEMALQQWGSYLRWFSHEAPPKPSEAGLLTIEEGDEGKKPDDMLCTVSETALSLMKCVVGAGGFALPWAFTQSGYIGGIVGIFILGWLSALTMVWLIRAKVEVGAHSYAQLAQRLMGKRWAVLVDVATVVCGLGACCAYMDFISEMIDSLWDVQKWEVVMFLIIPCTGLMLLRSFKYLAFTSVLGDIALLLGVIAVMVDGFGKSIEDPSTLPAVRIKTLPNFISTAAFLFFVHFVAVPLQSNMREPERFPKALRQSYVFVTLLNATFGFVGYLFYRGDTKPIVVSNVSAGAFTTIVKIALSFDLLFTFPIVAAPGREIIEHLVIQKGASHIEWRKNFVRLGFVVVSAGVALLVPDFEDMVTLTGGLGLSFLALILPPLMYARINKANDNSPLPPAWRYFAYFVTFFGVFVLVSSTTLTLKKIAER